MPGRPSSHVPRVASGKLGRKASPRTPKGSARGEKAAADAEPVVQDAQALSVLPEGPSPASRDEVFAALNFVDLPNRSVWESVVLNMLRDKFSKLVLVFTHYCKQGSDCASIQTTSRLKLGGFKKMVKDANLEVRMYDIDGMSRLFAKMSIPVWEGIKKSQMVNPELTELQLHQFVSLLVNLAFLRENPRFASSKDTSKLKEETVPVLQCVQNMLNEFLPRMSTGNAADFKTILKSDKDALAACAGFKERILNLLEALKQSARQAGTDVYTEFCNFLIEHKVLGECSIQTTESTGMQVTHKSSLTILQARHCFLESQDPEKLALGLPVYALDEMMETLARCGDKKYSAILEMSFAERVRGMLQNVFGDATELELIREAVTPASHLGGDVFNELAKEVMDKNWLLCWRHLALKDLHGYPAWETQLHDILKQAFSELMSIFHFYCGYSLASADSVSSVTKLGTGGVMQLSKDTELCTKEFKAAELLRYFCGVSAEGGVEKAEKPKMRTSRGSRTLPSAGGGVKKKVEDKVGETQINLFEFVNFLVRVGFWRANPQWGSKYNKRELTPVPEAVETLLQSLVLPKAKRDRSGEFRSALANDKATQQVLAEYRERLQNWVRPILRSLRKDEVSNPKMTFKKWGELMSGVTGGDSKGALRTQAVCPKMVGEWTIVQESQITGDERTNRKNQLKFTAKLSFAQCSWNFLRSQMVEQLLPEGEGAGEALDLATLDFAELNECIARCASNCYENLLSIHLPSHGRNAMSMADAVRSWLQVFLFEKSHETCMWECTVIKAERYAWEKMSTAMAGQDPKQHKLWIDCWRKMSLMDIHYFPLWEKGVHDVLQAHFPALVRIFSHYCKGISGIDSATDALEMDVEEFHDFVKEAKLETRMVNFIVMENIFAKANAEMTHTVYEERCASISCNDSDRSSEKSKPRRSPVSAKRGAFPEVSDRFAPDYPEPGSLKHKKPNHRLSLTEFLACLVRLSFLRANPKFGQYDNKSKLVPLPGCLERMLKELVIPNAKQDMSSLFRDELAKDHQVQRVFATYRDKLKLFYNEVTLLPAPKAKLDSKLTMETWLDICRGQWAQRGGRKHQERWRGGGEEGRLGEGALVGEWTVHRESDITGDERCKEKFTCRLSLLQAKMAFLNSQSLDQISSGDASERDYSATLEFDEFCECLARCSKDKYGEIKQMSLADCVRGMIENVLGEKDDKSVIRDCTYLKAERYDWRLSKPLNGQSLSMHRKWITCWQHIEVSDLHHFPLWERGVHDILQESFHDLIAIFSHYAKSTADRTAEDSVEMTMSEFKSIVRDTSLETKDLKFDVMCSMFKKANLHSSDASTTRKGGGGGGRPEPMAAKTAFKGARSNSNRNLREEEVDQALGLYEFVEVLIRISFWRANPFHGIHKLAKQLEPLPDCLHQMLHEVVLPNSQRDDAMFFKDQLAGDKGMQRVLEQYDAQLRVWFNLQTQSVYLRGEGRKLSYQMWQEVLRKKKLVGSWEVFQQSEVTGDERCKLKVKCALSMPQGKFAFVNSQCVEQLSVGLASEKEAISSLDFEEFKECIARCGVDKYKAVRQMSAVAAVKGMIHNLLEIESEEEVMRANTRIKAARFNWRRYSRPVGEQTLREHKRWLQVWQRVDVIDVYHFPLWEKGVHDCLQSSFKQLELVFLAYARGAVVAARGDRDEIGSGSRDDAEMEMAELLVLLEECELATKEVNSEVMSRARNSSRAGDDSNASHEGAREGRGKLGGRGGRERESRDSRRGGDGLSEASVEWRLKMQDFLGLLIRVSFLRANPSQLHSNTKRPPTLLPDCLDRMIREEVLPRARHETPPVFRQTVMRDPSVMRVLDEAREKLRCWFDKAIGEGWREREGERRGLGLRAWLRICDAQDLVGNWQCFRESAITGDPCCKTEYKWRFSMAQARLAFLDSMSSAETGGGQGRAEEEEEGVIGFQELLECVARCGCDKYRAVEGMSSEAAVSGFIQNLLFEQTAHEVVAQVTRVHCSPFDPSEQTGEGREGEEWDRWLACWNQMELMELFMWPTWEAEVHDLLHQHFDELHTIFLAYTRSSAPDIWERATLPTPTPPSSPPPSMCLDEFYDFVVDVALETKKCDYDSMSSLFIKAKRTNRMDERWRKLSSGRRRTPPDARRKKPTTLTLPSAITSQNLRLELFEFLHLLVRIAFYRANPEFGLFGNTQPVIPVANALRQLLYEVILPNAKREGLRDFRIKEMEELGIVAVLSEYKPKLLAWYKKKTKDDTEEEHASDKLGFEEWHRVLQRQELTGVWCVEQRSEITGDTSTKSSITCRLSMAAAKAAFNDSRDEEGQAGEEQPSSELPSLSFDEWIECLARLGVLKYQAVKQMSKGAAVKGFLQNFFGEMSEEEVLTEGTYIRAPRFDWRNDSKPLDYMSMEDHEEWLHIFSMLQLSMLYGFPLWEREVHDLLQAAFEELRAIFRSYCRGGRMKEEADEALVMEMEEFHDFVTDCHLETRHYTFQEMKAHISPVESSGSPLCLHDFLAAVVRLSFYRLNPGCWEGGVDEGGGEGGLVHVPRCLESCLNDCILPHAHRDDSFDFRSEILTQSVVKAVLDEERERLLQWFVKCNGESDQMGLTAWMEALRTINLLGSFTCYRGSDVVGDERVGTEFKCRLSEAQARAAFVDSMREQGRGVEGGLDFEEIVECIARCGVDKYRAVGSYIDAPAAISGFIANMLGDANEEQVITRYTYIFADRFDASGCAEEEPFHEDWLETWSHVQLSTLHLFPTWEEEVHDLLKAHFGPLKSIFRAYAAGTALGIEETAMEMDEFHDFVTDADLLSEEYSFEAISSQFTKAVEGARDEMMELSEFLTMVVRVAFYRAELHQRISSAQQDRTTLPSSLEAILLQHIFPNCRRDDGPPFSETLNDPGVQAEIRCRETQIFEWHREMSEGRGGVELRQWMDAIEARLLFADLRILEYRCRFTEPQARHAFLSSVSQNELGLQPEELIDCLVRSAVEKYKRVLPMSKAQAVDGFLQNFFDGYDEEKVIYSATGHGNPPNASSSQAVAKPLSIEFNVNPRSDIVAELPLLNLKCTEVEIEDEQDEIMSGRLLGSQYTEDEVDGDEQDETEVEQDETEVEQDETEVEQDEVEVERDEAEVERDETEEEQEDFEIGLDETEREQEMDLDAHMREDYEDESEVDDEIHLD